MEEPKQAEKYMYHEGLDTTRLAEYQDDLGRSYVANEDLQRLLYLAVHGTEVEREIALRALPYDIRRQLEILSHFPGASVVAINNAMVQLGQIGEINTDLT